MVRSDLPLAPRTFILLRHEDVHEQSGEGVVAEGVQFSDGTCAMRWRTTTASTCLYNSVEDVQELHGHEGRSELLWCDELDVPPEG
jgi:hypothetical protein